MKKIFYIIIFISLTYISYGQTWSWAETSVGTPTVGNEGYAICTDANNNVYITGLFGGVSISFGTYTLTNVGASNIFVVKYDPSGNVIWAKGSTGLSSVAYGISSDINGNVFVTGFYNGPSISFGTFTLANSGTSNIFIAKYDSNGNELWARNGIGTGSDEGQSICVDNNGNAYVTGFFSSSLISFGTCTLSTTSGNCFCTKYDPNGNALWAKSTSGSGSAIGFGICTNVENGVYITGSYSGPSISAGTYTINNAGNSDIFIAKYDNLGNILWLKGAGNTGDDISNSISTDACGNAYIFGDFNSPSITFGSYTLTNINPSKLDVFLSKFDNEGNVLWSKSINGIDDDFGYSVSVGNNGVFVTGGLLSSSISIGGTILTIPTGSIDPIYLIKFDFNGNLLCATSLSSGGDDQFQICANQSGDAYLSSDYLANPFYVGTNTLIPTAMEEIYVAKYICTTTGSVCTTTGISELNKKNSIVIFPNPNNGSFNLQIDIEISNGELILMNYLGQKIYEQEIIKGENEIKTIGLSSGLYNCILLSNKHQIGNSKLSIE